MHADGEQKHDQLKQNVNMLQGHAGMSSILTCGPASPNLCRRRGGGPHPPGPPTRARRLATQSSPPTSIAPPGGGAPDLRERKYFLVELSAFHSEQYSSHL